MINFSSNPNVVSVSWVPSKCYASIRCQSADENLSEGCCHRQYDSTFPILLNGIITEDEFRQSIDNINRTVASKRPQLLGTVIAAIFLGIGVLFFIGGGITMGISGSTKYLYLIGVGFALFFVGMIIFTVSFCIAQAKLMSRWQEAIAQESAKYSQRSPIPCSWRLDTTRTNTGHHNTRRVHISYHVSSYRAILGSIQTI